MSETYESDPVVKKLAAALDNSRVGLWLCDLPAKEEPDFLLPLSRSSDEELSQIADWKVAQRDLVIELADAWCAG